MATFGTSFTEVYDVFFSKITDDMYMELTYDETRAMCQKLLLSAIPYFEFPRQNLQDYSLEINKFKATLTQEEKNILATYMLVPWLDQQIANADLVRMHYSGSDFKFTSQANHLSKLAALRDKYLVEGKHLQRLYKRRKADENGIMRPTMSSIMYCGEDWAWK
jgi:hypothetical protein